MPKPLPNGPTEWAPANLMTPLNANALMAMTQPAFAAIADFNGKLYDSATRFNTEWAEFLGRRLQEDFAVPQRLSACKSPQEAQQIYVDYWKTAFAQYQDEMGRLAKMSETFARQTASAMQKHAEAMTEETQLAA
jgi:cation transport regulator ChaB